MRRLAIASAVFVLLYAATILQAQVCRIVNGSFELDEQIADISRKDPNGWDVNMPAGKFQGYVYMNWPTEGQYNLTLYADWFVTFTADQKALVSQQIDLTDVNEIILDLKLQTYSFSPWDPAVCVPVLVVDNDVVWQPAVVTPDLRGEYRNQRYAVGDKYRDNKPHRLSVGLQTNLAGMLFERYITQWDSIRCTLFCNGFGLLAGDFNRDCSVDATDLKLLTDAWAGETPLDDLRNLFSQDDFLGTGGVITFRDFVVFGSKWDGRMTGLHDLAQRWLQEVNLDDPVNFFHGDDAQPHGIINFFDFVLFAEDWLGSSLSTGQQL